MTGPNHPEFALFTGGSSELALESMRSMLAQGERIVAHYRRSTPALESLRSEHPEHFFLEQADFGTPEAATELSERIRRIYGYPSRIAVFQAPPMAYHRFKDLTAEILERELRIQFHSAFEILRQFLPEMGKRKSGKVLVLLSSVTIGVPPKAMAHYVCAKYALLGLVRALASEYADRGVCVNAISPGMIDTRFLAELPDHLVEMVAAQSPRGRNARVNEVAPLVQWLLSDQAGFVSGANLPASGGGNF